MLISPAFTKSLFIFRRDLRLADNTGLQEALRSSGQVIPCFIFDPRQVGDNKYKSLPAIEFMLNSLEDLDQDLRRKGGRLFYFRGRPEKIVQELVSEEKIQAVFVNRDYTPFARRRDGAIKKVCRDSSISFNSFDDALLTVPGKVLKPDGKPYVVFTPFYKKARQSEVRAVRRNLRRNYYDAAVACSWKLKREEILPKYNAQLLLKGGRREALALMRGIKALGNYDEVRDFPALSGTTRLSAHNKFGTVSIREVYHSICSVWGDSHELIRELYWRDFFTHIACHFPHVFKGCFYRKYDQLKWSDSRSKFNSWSKGQTGFPIVDAGMRELNSTGFMHNRVRMIAASFLTKDLQLSWRWGEKYFASKLLDYDPAVNNGNWQWAASTGCDAQPYFRIFNPWIQQKKFDPQCEYIRKWVPELKNRPVQEIHGLAKGKIIPGYVKAMVNHSEAREIVEDLFDQLAEGS
jgi:deoxyribodipyrimidine photo-lyase